MWLLKCTSPKAENLGEGRKITDKVEKWVIIQGSQTSKG